MELHRKAPFAPLAATAIAAAIFAIDTLTSFDVAIAVLYVSVVMLSLSFADRRGMLLIAAGCMGLTLVSFAISHGFGASTGAYARCAVSLAAIAITTLLALQVRGGIAVLGRSEQRYRNIFLASGTAILEMDFSELADALDGLKAAGFVNMQGLREAQPSFVRRALGLMRLSNANDTTLKLFGAASVEELRAALPSLIPCEVEETIWLLLEAIWEDRTSFEAESSMQALDGRRLNVVVTVALPESVPKLGQVLLSIMDVTARREAEAALQATQTELAHVARISTLGELMASISHEVNQPLAAIVTNGQAGLRWVSRDVPDIAEVRSSLERMIGDAKRAGEVIQRLRALSSNSAPLQTPVSLNEIIEETLTLVQREILAHQIMLRLSLLEDAPPVIGDRVQLQQVVINLVVNAIQAMSSVDERARTLTLRSRSADGMIVLSIEDTGPGFPGGVPAKLFTPFYTTKANGMGMGLSICRSIVDAHGGRIRARSGAVGGAVFEIELPSYQEAA
ncbi:ATP-binding protein [Kaistia dalseonensis]|uniref:histidine kinase n=1 Tax=Kaistia dalseonensis TaxID=410840 RepID=A0ABU0H0J1_9HYPH|nr:ATP-binding protein [Kaistia dalseonensis]MCX5493277.1 ATP-binding protein [Kaistia dalseonensis]MDQ0435834.1 signal transduction histidine kinase [Kaistia dalseonensis]